MTPLQKHQVLDPVPPMSPLVIFFIMPHPTQPPMSPDKFLSYSDKIFP